MTGRFRFIIGFGRANAHWKHICRKFTCAFAYPMFNYAVHIFLVISFMLQGAGAAAQLTADSFERYTSKQGLSDNNITCVTQDSLGYLWIATTSGLNRFDGKTFSIFNQGNNIRDLKKLDSGRIGIITRSGFQCLDTRTLERKNYSVPATNTSELRLNRVYDAGLLNNGTLALSTATGFYIMNKSGQVIFRYDHHMAAGPERKVTGRSYGREIFPLHDGNVLLYMFDEGLGVGLYQPAVGKYVHLDMNKPSPWSAFYWPPAGWISRNQIDAESFILVQYFKDSIAYYNHRLKKKTVSPVPFKIYDDLTWESRVFRLTDSTFAINSGVMGFYIFHLNKETGAITFDRRKYLKEYKCNYLFSDRDRRLWVGTSLGLLCQKKGQNFFSSYFLNTDTTLRDARFYTMYRHKGLFYIGHHSLKASLTIVDTATMRVVKKLTLFKKGDLRNEQISIRCYYPDTLWLGTSGGLLWLDTRTYRHGKVDVPPALEGKAFNMGPVMKNGDAWMVSPLEGIAVRYNTHNRSFTYYTPATKPALPFYMVKHLAYDAFGDVWLSGHGLARWNYRTERFDTLITTYQGMNKSEDDILMMSADKRGSLWFHSAENGLQEYIIKEGKFNSYTQANGLASNVISNLSTTEINNRIWFTAANWQIGFIDLRTREFITQSKSNEVPEEPPFSKFIYFDEAANKCYMLTSNHLIAFSPTADTVVHPANPILIEQVTTQDMVMNYPKDSLRLPYSQNTLIIEFTQINFTNTASDQFYYRLDEDQAWIPLRGQRTVYINRLSPGEYTFQIRSVGRNQEEKIKQIMIAIRPPFWETWWFILLAVVLISGCILGIIKWRESVLNKLNEEKIKAQHQQNRELQHRLELEQITNFFTCSVADKNSAEDILWDVARNLIRKLGFTDCMMYLWDNEKNRLVRIAGFGRKAPAGPRGAFTGGAAIQELAEAVARTKEPLIVPDNGKNGRYRIDGKLYESEICVPILYHQELVGVIDSGHHQKDFFTPRHLQIMTTIAALIAAKIKSIENKKDIQQKKLELAVLNQQLTEMEMKALHAQMNPHFIFNCLNSIIGMIMYKRNEEAYKYLNKFAQLIRANLEHSKRPFITLEQNINYLHNYLKMEQLRFSDLEYEMVVDGNLDIAEIMIAPMLIQPLVENAIWHGLQAIEERKRLCITFLANGADLVCEIEDNGVGINKASEQNNATRHLSIGIDNIKKRIELLRQKYDIECSLEFTDKGSKNKGESGTIVTLIWKIV